MTKVAVARPERKHTALKRALAEPGRPLPDALRVELEAKFAADFRRIRIHTGSLADQAARSLDANALTFGQDIFFRAGMWRPETPGGFELIAHEAAHTLQQTAAAADCSEARVSEPGDLVEREADTAVEHGVAPRQLTEAVVARRMAGIAPRTIEQADPARTIEDIGRSLLKRVRADSYDRSGRVRNQLIRMEDNLRRDVLQWLERRMESHEWRLFVELLAEPAPSGTEGTEDPQIQSVGGPAPTDATAATAEAEAAQPTKVAARAEGQAATAEQAEPAQQTAPAERMPGDEEADAQAQPQEAAVAQPQIEGEGPAPPAAAEGGGQAGPSPQGQAGLVSVPDAPPAPAEQPAESAGAIPPMPAEQSSAGEEATQPGSNVEEAAAPTEERASEGIHESGAAAEASSTAETASTPGPSAPETMGAPDQESAAEPEAASTSISDRVADVQPPDTGNEDAATAESTGPEPSSGSEEAADASATGQIAEEPSAEGTSMPAEPEQLAEPAPAVEAPHAEMATAADGSQSEEASAESGPQSPISASAAGGETSPMAGSGGAVPPALLGEFAGEPTENEAASAAGGAGGGGGGGGETASEAPADEVPAPAVAPDNPVGAMQSIGTMRVAAAAQAMGAAAGSVSTQMSGQRAALESQPPTVERPTGAPQGAAGSTPGNVQLSPPGRDPAPIPATAAGQAVPLPPAPALPQPGAPVTQAVAPPRVTGTAQGQVSEADARRVKDAVDNVPVTDEALNVDAGAAPDLPLEGDADPTHADTQRTALLDSAATAQEQGAEEAAAPMGEDHIYPDVQPGTIRPQAVDCSCGGGQAAQPTAAGTAPDAGVAAVAEQERGDQVRQAANDAAGDLGQKQQQQAVKQQQANTDSQREVNQAIDDNARRQRDARSHARREVEGSRRAWSEGQRTAVDSARTESDTAVASARRDVSAEQTRAHTEAAGHIATGNQEIARTRAESEQKARNERDRSERESDDGILSWLASSITSFFNRLRDAIHAVFDAARRVVRAAIDTAQRLARGVIDLARRAVVGLIKAAGAVLLAIGDRLLAAFPGLRARFRAAIEKVVNAAVTAVNALANLLERAITALLNTLLAAINAVLCAYEAIYMAIVNTVAGAVQGAISFARTALLVFGAFAALVKDIAPNPGQWVRNLGASVMDGLRNHLWTALKTAVKKWFNETIEGIIGMGRMLLDLLRRGGITLRKIAGFVWQAILSSLPGIIIQFLIKRLISLLFPAAGAILLVIEGLVAAWGAVQRIIQALQLFFVFLKAVKGGGAGPQFATALAASAVVLIQFVASFLMARLGRAASGVAGRLKALATRLMAFFRRAARAVGRVARRVGRVVMRGVRAVGRLARRGLQAAGRILQRTRAGRAILRGVRRVQGGIGRMRQRFREWRERRRRTREQRSGERVARALRELAPRITATAQRGVRRVAMAIRLAFWRLRYRLRTLRLEHSGGGATLYASASPEQSTSLTLKDLPDSLLRDVVRTAVDRVLLSREVERAEAALPADSSAPVNITHPRDYLAYARRYSDQSRTTPLRFPEQRLVNLAPGITNFETGPSRRGFPLTRATTIKNQITGAQGPYANLVPQIEAIGRSRGAPARKAFAPVENLVRWGRPEADPAVADLALLMFGRESIRNPANAAHAVFTLDRIRSGQIDPPDLLTRLPQAPRGANRAAERLEQADFRSVFLRDENDPALAGRGTTTADTAPAHGVEPRTALKPLMRPDEGEETAANRRRARTYRASEADLTREWLILRRENWSFADLAEARVRLTEVVVERLVGFYRLRGVRARVQGR